ncbi:hypothetical protein CERSUDRAFT_105713 [Gelatoporia subvermispora B]|uniref:RING-type domain-containing protein n=1 Tax=Ceriporiopsis subvermispora (strain B) TaxID=914234 RepID=M2PN20_CERS8|nr:hypothetical protein CERSUDRAFT_105713 [Gelatoporia subvermispora B]
MSAYNYVENPNVNLVCCICRAPFFDPHTTRSCCHTFCYDCIARAISVSRQCPIDRLPLSLHDLTPADPVIRNLVEELIVECPYREAGCSYTCQRLLLPAHLKDVCEFAEVLCTHEQCCALVARKDLVDHWQTHRSRTHKPLTADVEQKDARPREADSEYTTTLEASVQTVAAPEDTLATENAMLRMRLSALEGVVHSLHRQMQAVQRALGPWYRLDNDTSGVSISTEDAGPVATLFHDITYSGTSEISYVDIHAEISEASAGEMRRPDSSPRQARRTESLSGVLPTRAEADAAELDIASYFPPADDDNVYDRQLPQPESRRERDRRPTVASTPQRSLSQTMQPLGSLPQSFTSPVPPAAHYSSVPYSPVPGFPPNPPYAAPAPGSGISIPPLDPTTSLPDTLASLHGSLVTLAGALGGIASAQTAEALRVGEELRGLRAGMHGLRMQVHDLLTVRAVQAGRDTSAPQAGPAGSAGDSVPGGGFGSGAPPWVAYGPRPPMGAYLHSVPPMPASVTKL